MRGIEKINWTWWDKDEVYLAHNSCFLDYKWLCRVDNIEIDLNAKSY